MKCFEKADWDDLLAYEGKDILANVLPSSPLQVSVGSRLLSKRASRASDSEAAAPAERSDLGFSGQ